MFPAGVLTMLPSVFFFPPDSLRLLSSTRPHPSPPFRALTLLALLPGVAQPSLRSESNYQLSTSYMHYVEQTRITIQQCHWPGQRDRSSEYSVCFESSGMNPEPSQFPSPAQLSQNIWTGDPEPLCSITRAWTSAGFPACVPQQPQL